MNRLTRDGTAGPVSRDQILRRERGQGSIHFSYSADHEQDWQPCPVGPYCGICDDRKYIDTLREFLTSSLVLQTANNFAREFTKSLPQKGGGGGGLF